MPAATEARLRLRVMFCRRSTNDGRIESVARDEFGPTFCDGGLRPKFVSQPLGHLRVCVKQCDDFTSAIGNDFLAVMASHATTADNREPDLTTGTCRHTHP